MNSKKFVDEVNRTLQSDKMSIFDTITSVMADNDLDIDQITEILKEEKTLLMDLRAECEENGTIKGAHKTNNIEDLF
jgi:hypothetical protein